MKKVKAVVVKVNRDTKQVVIEQSTGDKFRYDREWAFFQTPLIKDYGKVADRLSRSVAGLWSHYYSYRERQDARGRLLEALNKINYTDIKEVEIKDELYSWFPSTSVFMRMYLIELLGWEIKDVSYLSLKVEYKQLHTALKSIPASFEMLKLEADELLDFLKNDEDFDDVAVYYIQGDDLYSAQRQFMYLWESDKEKAQIYFLNRFITRSGYQTLKGPHTYSKFDNLVFDHIESYETIKEDMFSLFGNNNEVVKLEDHTFHKTILFKEGEPYFFTNEEKYFYKRNEEIYNSLPDVFASGGLLFTKSRAKGDHLFVDTSYHLDQLKYSSSNVYSSSKGIYISKIDLIDYNMPRIQEMLEEDYETLRNLPTIYKLRGRDNLLSYIKIFYSELFETSNISPEDIIKFSDPDMTQEEVYKNLLELMERVPDGYRNKEALFKTIAVRSYTTKIFERFKVVEEFKKEESTSEKYKGLRVYDVKEGLRDATHLVVEFNSIATYYKEPKIYLESGNYVLQTDNYLPSFIFEFEGMDQYKIADGIYVIPKEVLHENK